ncbi:hypothetical protein [Burkholderia pyrrocinia]|uniref:hypothetical protein n=1 Tax=Burkholderia pyrrocinia TaxID=60550 RepID=UPI0030D3D14E
MSFENKVIAYAELVQSTQILVGQCLAAAAVEEMMAPKLAHVDFAQGDCLLWYRIASRLASKNAGENSRLSKTTSTSKSSSTVRCQRVPDALSLADGRGVP